jgi:hypothetical protein
VYVQYSWAKTRIPLPESSNKVIIATPYVNMGSGSAHYTLGDPRSDLTPNFVVAVTQSYYTHNWLVADYFFYSFTEDADGNGRIDRIRAQAAFDLTGGAQSFDDFLVLVDGYEIDISKGTKGYARVDEDDGISSDPFISQAVKDSMRDMIFIYLKEKDYSDTGNRLTWRIVRNTTLKDLATRSIEMRLKDGQLLTWDTAPPRINYALTMPGAGEIYVQFSEPVEVGEIAVSSIDGPASPAGHPAGTLHGIGGDDETLIPLTTSYQVENLARAAPPEFTLEEVRDKAVFAEDVRTQPVTAANLYPYLYPSPKYPENWTYKEYKEIMGNGSSIAFHVLPSGGLLPLIKDWSTPRPGNLLNNGGVGDPLDPYGPYGQDTHRVTDVLISSPPVSEDDPGFFAWPIWAKYTTPPNDAMFPQDDAGWGTGGAQPTDTGIIWDFTGRNFLEERNITLQIRTNSLLSGLSSVDVYLGLNVPNEYRNPPEYNTNARGSGGLWLPSPNLPLPTFFNLTPKYYPDATKKPQDAASTPSNHLYIYKFDKDIDDYKSPSRFDFLFHLYGTPVDLFAARLDTAASGPWYRRVRPFSFDIHAVTLQRGGATILNNVINPNNGERAYIRYHLVKSGRVTIQVFTLDGTLVKTLRRENRGAGEWVDSWNGTNNGGRPVARGMYFIRVVGPDIDEIRKVMVVK